MFAGVAGILQDGHQIATWDRAQQQQPQDTIANCHKMARSLTGFQNSSSVAFSTPQTPFLFLFCVLSPLQLYHALKRKHTLPRGFHLRCLSTGTFRLSFWGRSMRVCCRIRTPGAALWNETRSHFLPRRSNTARLSRIVKFFRPRHQSQQCKQDLRQSKTAAAEKRELCHRRSLWPLDSGRRL